ncbi:hypothetical protein PRUPE_2G322000 [Prunus persica]|uniref:Thaumatin-like protein 1 n=1 Tax=Prunus persica TaxID=3760 RepID=M5XTE7_PRUPE|nr:thaumatin-like protein 1 [Prunus persica]ONI25820.1 hypothetical protein PRUPE_2G322000 [Prunus persica]
MTPQTFPCFLFILFPLFFSLSCSCTFTITNNCPDTIWPGTLAGSGRPQLPTTGFRLDSGQSARIPPTPEWSGRIWARTGCTFDELGAGTCQTGDCGGRLECNGNGATPPASLFEITLGNGNDKDFYDVSIVDGYNLPLIASPRGVYGACNATGCASDINIGCPKELQVVGGVNEGSVVGCKSACDAFGLDQYCCSGQFANPTTCQPSFYSTIFKRACPRAYSYAFDDGTSTFTCKAFEYAIVFCPNGNGTTQPDDSLAPPRYQVPGSEKVVRQMVSSSNMLLPIPSLILLLIFFYILS